MNIVMIVPTGLGCTIGGHAGDATPAARLLGACCNKIFLHPNVVNASDINEMPSNALYIEGSMLSGFLEGDFQLEEVKSNRVLVVTNKPIQPETVNAVNAARACMGVDIVGVLGLDRPLEMLTKFDSNGRATGEVRGWEELCKQVHPYDFDALAISTVINCPEDVQLKYMRDGGVNPWGGVESMASELISNRLRLPVAHAPVQSETISQELKIFNEIVDPRDGAEVVSWAFLHCVLKGLHKAPRLGTGWKNTDIDYLITPIGCVGRPHQACMEAGIPIITVQENKSVLNDLMPKEWIHLNTYLEVAGFLMCKNVGMTVESISRPLKQTEVFNG